MLINIFIGRFFYLFKKYIDFLFKYEKVYGYCFLNKNVFFFSVFIRDCKNCKIVVVC